MKNRRSAQDPTRNPFPLEFRQKGCLYRLREVAQQFAVYDLRYYVNSLTPDRVIGHDVFKMHGGQPRWVRSWDRLESARLDLCETAGGANVSIS